MAQTTAARKLAEFLKSEGVTGDRLPAWEREMGFSKDSVRKFIEGKTHMIGNDRLEIIGRRYPHLNFQWLLRNGDVSPSVREALRRVDQIETEINALRRMLLAFEQ